MDLLLSPVAQAAPVVWELVVLVVQAVLLPPVPEALVASELSAVLLPELEPAELGAIPPSRLPALPLLPLLVAVVVVDCQLQVPLPSPPVEVLAVGELEAGLVLKAVVRDVQLVRVVFPSVTGATVEP